MNKMFLDIETLPAAEEQHELLREFHKERKEKGKFEGSFEDYLAQTGFNGAFGRIFCISYALNNTTVQNICKEEKLMLNDFWSIAKNVDLFVGYNIFDFDLKFIYQRSAILGVRPTRELPFARYRNVPIYDVMCEWSKWSNQDRISLDLLAQAFNFSSPKEGMDGSQVFDYFKAGKYKEICEYCNRDVETTRKIYKKLTFEEETPSTLDLPF